MSNKNILAFLVIFFVILTSCSKDPIGTWNIKTLESNNPGKQGVIITNLGSITFNQDNTGTKDLKYAIFNNQFNDIKNFKWTVKDNYITIESDSSILNRTWIIEENSSKYQKWKATDGDQSVYVIELTQ